MKILLLATYFYPYEEKRKSPKGIHLASSSPEIAKKLGEKNEVSVISRKTGVTRKRTSENNVEVSRVRFCDRFGLRLISWVLFAFLEILRLSRERRYDVVLCWDWSTALPAILAKPFTKAPVICSLRNQSQAYANRRGIRFVFYYFLEYLTLNSSDFLVYSSLWTRETVDRVMEVRTPSRVLHHGIDTKRFNPHVKSDISERLGLGDFVVGFFGRLVREKGVYPLLRSFAELAKEKKGSSLLIVGDGPEMKGLKSLARELGISGHAHFTGFVHRNQIPKYMQACDVVVLPSEAEGFSSAVLESMAMGKVFVGTAVGGVPEIIENWNNGVIIKSDGFEDLRRALERLSGNKDLVKNIGRNAHRFITGKGYDWDSCIVAWEMLLEEVTGRKA